MLIRQQHALSAVVDRTEGLKISQDFAACPYVYLLIVGRKAGTAGPGTPAAMGRGDERVKKEVSRLQRTLLTRLKSVR